MACAHRRRRLMPLALATGAFFCCVAAPSLEMPNLPMKHCAHDSWRAYAICSAANGIDGDLAALSIANAAYEKVDRAL